MQDDSQDITKVLRILNRTSSTTRVNLVLVYWIRIADSTLKETGFCLEVEIVYVCDQCFFRPEHQFDKSLVLDKLTILKCVVFLIYTVDEDYVVVPSKLLFINGVHLYDPDDEPVYFMLISLLKSSTLTILTAMASLLDTCKIIV